jgi:hypothetical protein
MGQRRTTAGIEKKYFDIAAGELQRAIAETVQLDDFVWLVRQRNVGQFLTEEHAKLLTKRTLAKVYVYSKRNHEFTGEVLKQLIEEDHEHTG